MDIQDVLGSYDIIILRIRMNSNIVKIRANILILKTFTGFYTRDNIKNIFIRRIL